MDPFETLGMPPGFELERDLLERHYRDLQRALHPDKFVDATAAIRRQSLARAVDVNEAYRALRDELKRAEALLRRFTAGADTVAAKEPADPAFLMEVMELREGLAEARADGDLAAVSAIGVDASKREKLVRDQLAQAFVKLAEGTSPELLEQAGASLSRLRYYRRLRDEIADIEEEALG